MRLTKIDPLGFTARVVIVGVQAGLHDDEVLPV
jgi:hypothetical protein